VRNSDTKIYSIFSSFFAKSCECKRLRPSKHKSRELLWLFRNDAWLTTARGATLSRGCSERGQRTVMRSSLRHNRTMRAISKTRPLSRNTRGRARVGVHCAIGCSFGARLCVLATNPCYPTRTFVIIRLRFWRVPSTNKYKGDAYISILIIHIEVLTHSLKNLFKSFVSYHEVK